MSKRICYNAMTGEVIVMTGGKAAFNRCTYAMINYFLFLQSNGKYIQKSSIDFFKIKAAIYF